jgi:amidohydrolase
MDLYSQATSLFDYSKNLRRDFHRHPELAFHEVRTAGIVARELEQQGIEVSTGLAETGVVGILKGKEPGPVVLLRFDMDALPIQEENQVEYVSQTPGIMHACGHDGHVAIGLTVARLLQSRQADLKGTVKLVFQPAEEGNGGAQHMIAAGVLENPVPDYALALHLWNEYPVGFVAVVPGPFMSGAGFFSIKIIGTGGHGALPHQSADPVLAGAHVVTALQSIVSRNIPPLQSGVVSVTQFHAGDAHNVIPPFAELQGTIRYFEKNVYEILIERFHTIINGTAEAMGCKAEIFVGESTPPVVNDPWVVSRLQETFKNTIPGLQIDGSFRTMVSEDMAYMLEKVRGCYFMLGSSNPEKGLNAGHHHPRFDFDEQVLPRAATLMAAGAIKLLSDH